MPDRIADLMAWGLSEGVARRVASRDRPVGPVRDQRSDAERPARREVTPLKPSDEQQFQAWVTKNHITDLDHPDSHYDYRGYWKDVAGKGVDQRKQYDDGLHFPDTYKQHGHPTFSVESKYSSGPNDGGAWYGETFIPQRAVGPVRNQQSAPQIVAGLSATRDRLAQQTPTERLIAGIDPTLAGPRRSAAPTVTLASLTGRESPPDELSFGLNPKRWIEEKVFTPALSGVGSLIGALDRPPTGYPADTPYTSPLRIASSAFATMPAAAGLVYDALAGQRTDAPVVDPMRPSEEQATGGGEVARRGGGPIAQALGTLADVVVGPEHGLQLLGAAAPVFMGAGTLAKVAKEAQAARALKLTGEMASSTRASKAENVAAGLYHPVGLGKKLSVPISEMNFQYEQLPGSLAPRRRLLPERFEGAAIIPATGDRSRAGLRLTRIGDTDVDVPLRGGPDFMRTNASENTAWASTPNALSKLANKAQDARKASLAAGGSGDVYMVYMPQGFASLDFSTFTSDALMQQIRTAPITTRTIKDFDSTLRNIRPEWVGLDHPSAQQQLVKNGELRHAFVDTIKLDRFGQSGFPDVATTRAALVEPALMDVPNYHGGYTVAKVDTSRGVVTDAPNPHPTYASELPGRYVGGLPGAIPPELLFESFYRSRRRAGGDPTKDFRAFMLSNPIQVVTPSWIKKNSEYLKEIGAVSLLLPAAAMAKTQPEN